MPLRSPSMMRCSSLRSTVQSDRSSWTAPAEAETRANEMVRLVGLTDRAGHFVHQLSGGEQQRTAIARALVHRPSLLIADEPTGNLDTVSAERVLGLLREIAEEKLATLILVTHSAEVAALASRLIEMRDGKILRDESHTPAGEKVDDDNRKAGKRR